MRKSFVLMLLSVCLFAFCAARSESAAGTEWTISAPSEGISGFQSNPLDWMCEAKCVVVPSFWQEPYGLVAAEAVALGRPVVAFAIGGLPEACGGKATLVPPGDIDALADALELP